MDVAQPPIVADGPSPGHPVRLVVSDDLQRSRLTVGFRLFLALPHLFWAALFGVVAGVLCFVNWWVVLFRGQTPDGIHSFLAGYLRYLTHVEAYLFLAANPFPAFYLGDQSKGYPVDLEIAPPERQNRWTVGFRLLLAIPAILIGLVFVGAAGGPTSYGSFRGGILFTVGFLLWFAALARGRASRGLRDLGAWSLGYSGQLSAYLFILTDRYPNSGPGHHLGRVQGHEGESPPDPPARLVVSDGELRRSRLTVFFRLLLAFPHFVWLLLWAVVALIVAVLNWFATLAIGRSPRPFARFLAAFVRYSTHVTAFLFLIGNQFPGFTGRAGSYPIDLELDPFRPQHRLVTAFRILLGLPALLINAAVGGLLGVAGLLGWFASLARGRMPEGLRDAGAYALGYAGQVNAYLFLLSDRYPYSGPLSADAIAAAEPGPAVVEPG